MYALPGAVYADYLAGRADTPPLCLPRSCKRTAGLGPGMTVPPCQTDDLGGWCHRAWEAPLETLISGPTTAWPDVMPGRLRAAGLHNVHASKRRQRPGQHRTNPVRADRLDDIDDVGVFLGLDVGKSAHHGRGLTPAWKKVFDKQLPNSEPKLRAVFDKLAAKFGPCW